MRNAILYWSLGLISIGSLTGCEALRSLGEGNGPNNQRVPVPSAIDHRVLAPNSSTTTIAVYTESIPTKSKSAPPVIVSDIPPIRESLVQRVDPYPKPRTTERAVDTPRKIAAGVKTEIDCSEPIVISAGAATIDNPSAAVAATPAVPASIGSTTENQSELASAKIQVAATESFKSLTGNVQLWRKTWRLRFAPVEEEAVHGGSVVLEGADVDRLRDGQTVRVQGVLIAPAERTSPARYRVQSIEILD